MLNNLKKKSIAISIIASMALVPMTIHASSGNAMVEGSSESTSALIEAPNIETQLNRINVGINVVRVNEIILNNMPISADASWPEKLSSTPSYEVINQHSVIKNDPYYATIALSNVFLGQPATLSITPVGYALYHNMMVLYVNEAQVPQTVVEKDQCENYQPAQAAEDVKKPLYPYVDFMCKTEANTFKEHKLPDVNMLPSLRDLSSYVKFPDEQNVKLISVTAESGTLYENIEDATLSLAPDDFQEQLNDAKKEFKDAKEEYLEKKAKYEGIKAWLKDDKNSNSPQKADKEEEEKTVKFEMDEVEKVLTEKEDIYVKLIEDAANAIENNFDSSKVQLAQKIDMALDVVDGGAIRAISVFTAATAHLMKNGFGSISDELAAIQKAQALSTLVGNQKNFLAQRYARIGTGALYALPNIAMGTYFATKQTLLAGTYQKLVKKTLEAHEADEKAKAAAAEQ